jgi:serine/threonine protein phosphatase PrpC
LQSGETDAARIAEELVDLSLNKGSKDNISAVVVTLEGVKFCDGSGVEGRRTHRRLAEEATAGPPQSGSGPPLKASRHNERDRW